MLFAQAAAGGGGRNMTDDEIAALLMIIAVAVVILAAQTRVGTGYYLPTVYTLVFAFTLLSGIHYVFFVSRLLNDDRK